MPYQELQEFNQTGLGGIFTYTADLVPQFFPLVLFALFIIVALGTYFAQRVATGRGEFFSSLAVAGYFTTIISFVMSLVPGLIQPLAVAVCLVVSIVCTILLLFKGTD